MTVADAFRRALASQLSPAMLALAIGPVVAAAVFWAVVMWWKWAAFLGVIDTVIRKLPYMDTVVERLVFYGIQIVPGMLTLWILAAMFIPLTLVCALGFVSVAGMPLMLRHVAGRHFPALARRRGGSLAGSLVNSLGALIRFLLLALISFPLWFVPVVGWLVLPLLLGRLNAGVLRYDALADHASAREMAALAADRALSWQWLGFAGALLNVVPLFWFFSTTLTGLAFIHYGLAALERRRVDLGEPADAVA
ncbi:MAG: EI24 domain-containing protein [Burkholderiales bacterium]|nr:EI24 domain-containing protein [Burkholderiales bacterium]